MLKLPPIFSDHMVLQREKPVVIFGTGTPAKTVTVTVAPVGLTAVGTVSADGCWRVTLPPVQSGTNCVLTVESAGESLSFSDVAYGEVWLAGGQSNMEYMLAQAKNGAEELRNCADSGVRYFQVPRNTFVDEQYQRDMAAACWQTASPEASGTWSAVAYIAAKELVQKTGVPVGIIGCNFGGSSVSCWMPEEDLQAHAAGHPYLEDYRQATAGKTDTEMIAAYDAYTVYHAEWEKKANACYQEDPKMPWEEIIRRCGENRWPGPLGIKSPYRPAGMYHTMLKTVAPYTLRGFFYYQGENDDHRPDTYATLLSVMIARWRREFEDETLPFLLVQLPMYTLCDMPEEEQWSKLREAQLHVFRTVKNTGLAVILDCGEYGNIHPTDKHAVGHRLALLARHLVYGETELTAFAPLYRCSYVIGGEMTICFDYAENGLEWHGEPDGFELCGSDGVWHPAKAVIVDSAVKLTCTEVPQPVAGRYAWVNYGPVTLYGKNGIPASPFRTAGKIMPLTAQIKISP